ncbi:MAG: hypothetical protein ACFUZC_10395 [Chthoniobacteraceae bacterium]
MNHRSKISLYLALTAVLTSVALCADTPVALVNPGFEDPFKNGWDLWISPDSLPNNCHCEVTTETPHSGSACLKLSADAISRFSAGRKEVFPVQAAERYRIGIWVRGDAEFANSSAVFLVRITLAPAISGSGSDLLHIGLDGKITRNADPYTNAPLSAQWKRVTAVFEIPATAQKMGIGVFLWNAKGNIYIDDFTLEKVDAATPLSEMTSRSK